ncbi:MAG: hypothetical protein Q7R76_03190 [Candidatus Woesearchaeota archaeon]|nr:hypothetical protein [Candidatus Woesearchaeota archaeon]
MFTLQQIIDATEEGLRELYEKKLAERDQELSKRVLALARLAYNSNGSKGRTAYHLALALAARNRNSETITYFEEAITKEPGNADYHGDYATTLLVLNMSHNAQIHINRAQHIDPRNGQFDCIEGEIAETTKDYECALRCYKRGKAKLELHENPKREHVRSLRLSQESIVRTQQRLDGLDEMHRQAERETYVPPWSREHWGGIIM